jgi:hypothetical protein
MRARTAHVPQQRTLLLPQLTLQVTFPASLTARQRALLHEFAEGVGLQHASTGEGSDRRLQLGPDDATTQVCAQLPSVCLSSTARSVHYRCVMMG